MALTRPLVTLAALALVAGCGTETEPSPASAPSPAPRTYLTEVPADFPLADPDAGWQDTTEAPPVYVCGPDRYTPGEDRRGATLTGGETNAERDLTVYADDEAASAALATVKAAVAQCPEQDRGEGEFVAPRPMDSDLGEESVAWLDQYGDGDGPNGEGSVIALARVGNAVLLTRTFVLDGAKDLAWGQAEVDRLGEDAAGVVDAMCAFSAAGCDHEIPDGFALDTGLSRRGEDRVVGPARSLPGVDLAALCPVGDWPYAPDDRLAVRATGPEYAETRELLVYPDADAAADALASARSDVEACAPETGQRLDVLDVLDGSPAGGDAAFTFAQTYDEGLGGTVFQLVLRGRAVLAVASTGELLPETVQQSAEAFTQRNRAVVDLLCEWTEAGC